MDELFSIAPWNTLQVFRKLSEQLKQEHPLPEYTTKIAIGTATYETIIRNYWEAFKRNPNKANAEKFVNALVKSSDEYWRDYMADVLGVNVDDLTPAQLDLLSSALDEHHGYLKDSLLPDLIAAIVGGLDDFGSFDYRAIFLYAGALWSFGFLSTISFDGLEVRDAADLFMFLGPNDENTCDGPRGCKQYVNNVYTVAEIAAQNIVPGRLRCLTSCRHILIPVASPLG